jgi:hypothetical protein
MKTSDNSESLPVSRGLLAQVRAAADAEQRPTAELVREAIERYLTGRRQSRGFDRPKAP